MTPGTGNRRIPSGFQQVPAHSFAQRAKSLEGRVALVAGGAALMLAPMGRVPTAAQSLFLRQPTAAPTEPQTHVVLTLATAVTVVLAISVTFFLLGLLCGSLWRRRRGRRYWR